MWVEGASEMTTRIRFRLPVGRYAFVVEAVAAPTAEVIGVGTAVLDVE